MSYNVDTPAKRPQNLICQILPWIICTWLKLLFTPRAFSRSAAWRTFCKVFANACRKLDIKRICQYIILAVNQVPSTIVDRAFWLPFWIVFFNQDWLYEEYSSLKVILGQPEKSFWGRKKRQLSMWILANTSVCKAYNLDLGFCKSVALQSRPNLFAIILCLTTTK